MKRTGLCKLANGAAKWEESDELVYYRGKLYVSNNVEIHRKILEQCYNSATIGHPGCNLILELVKHYYWWPLMYAFVDKYVQGCEQCQCFKPILHPKPATLPIAIPEGPWQIIGTDLVTRLPPSKGIDGKMYTAIAMYINLYMKQAHFTFTTDKVDADDITDLHICDIFRLYGLPRGIISDWRPQFTFRFIKALYQKLSINSQLMTVYYPQANRQTECINKEIKQYLYLFA